MYNHTVTFLRFLLLQTIAGYLIYVSLNAYTTIGLHEFVSSPLYKDLSKGRLAPYTGQDALWCGPEAHSGRLAPIIYFSETMIHNIICKCIE